MKKVIIKSAKGKMMTIHYKTYLNTKVKLMLRKYNGEKKEVVVDGYLFGTLISILQRVLYEYDGVVLITGAVGSGKSSLAKLITAIWEWFFDRQQDINSIVFSSNSLLDLVEKKDNETLAINFDESVSGGTGRDSITKTGQALKKALITKRFKRHLYLLLIDEIQEYSKKIISRSRLWVHMEERGLERGYFKAYDNITQIKRMYRKIKQGLELEEVIKYETPAYFGHQGNTEGLFFNEIEYKEKKSNETDREDDKTNAKSDKVMNQRNILIKMLIGMNIKQKDIAKEIGLNPTTINKMLKNE